MPPRVAPSGIRPGEPGYLEGKGELVVNQIGCICDWPVLASNTRDREAESVLETECKDCAFKLRCMLCFPVYLCGREEKIWVPDAATLADATPPSAAAGGGVTYASAKGMSR